jgi:hypothetical protein
VRALIPFLSLVACFTTIFTGWWSINHRRLVQQAKIDDRNPVAVETPFARNVRRTLVVVVCTVLAIATFFGVVALTSSVWSLFQ